LIVSIAISFQVWAQIRGSIAASILIFVQMNKMDLNQEKIDIISWTLKEVEETSLRQMKELISEIEYDRTSDTKLIGYRMSGAKVFKSQFIQEIRQSERGVANGEFLTLDDLEKQSESW
jgi:hypothetical protein